MNNLQIQRSILKEIKNINVFFKRMEEGVKTGSPMKIKKAYHFLQTLVYHMDKGDLTPESVELFQALRESTNEEE